MTEGFVGKYIPPHLMSIAASIFARNKIDFASAKRASGWSNATWIASGFVLRLATEQGNDNLRRELQLSACLPPEVGYPGVVDHGEIDGFTWVLSHAIPGISLGKIWMDLSWEERTTAIRQLWAKAQAVHAVDPSAVENLVRKRAWFNCSDAREAEASLKRLRQLRILNSAQTNILGEVLYHFWKALPGASCVLNHGDLTIDNALWYEGQVVSLLDFEFAVIAPVALDLTALLKYGFGPDDDENSWLDIDRIGWERMRQAVVELAEPELIHPESKALLCGYSVLLELWRLEEWLAHPEGEGPLDQWDPYRRLISLADGRNGYLGLF